MVSALDYNFAEENDSNHGRLQGSTSNYKGTAFSLTNKNGILKKDK